ncbi:hypothetical protein BGZ47_008703 [Haplosporangium gracile]|nr:hypothetical protein BGZ47_008703 [Haplosporangium gracile]
MLRDTFYLGQDSRMMLTKYLRGQGWNLPEIASEADVAIARDFKPGDIVMLGDSDMTAYENVETISGGLCHKGGFWENLQSRIPLLPLLDLMPMHNSRSFFGDWSRSVTSAFVPTTSEGNVDIPNRFRIVDRPPNKRPLPHKSGRRYKHRPRYAIKTRMRKLEHEPPEGFKKYMLKPWKQREPSPEDNTATSATSNKLQKHYNPQPATNLIKKQGHISAMDFNRPIRTLTLGTVQANAKRAISRNITHSAERRSILIQGTRSGFQQVAEQASKAARTLQRGISMYLENLSARKVDEMDKLILRKLCPDITVEEITAFNNSTNQKQSVGQRQDQEHDQGPQSKYNEQEPFLQILLNAIMNSAQPDATANIRRTTANVELAREFFNRNNLYGVSGPPTKLAYPASTIAQLSPISFT